MTSNERDSRAESITWRVVAMSLGAILAGIFWRYTDSVTQALSELKDGQASSSRIHAKLLDNVEVLQQANATQNETNARQDQEMLLLRTLVFDKVLDETTRERETAEDLQRRREDEARGDDRK